LVRRAQFPTSSLFWRRFTCAFIAEVFWREVVENSYTALPHLPSRAPSSFGIQPFTVKVVTKPEVIQQLPALCYGQAHVGQAR
jgi:hypothetical protein